MKLCDFASAAGRMRVTVSVIMRAYLSPLSSYIYEYLYYSSCRTIIINPLNAELNPICHLLALLAHHILHVSGVRVNVRTRLDIQTVSGEHPPFRSMGKRVYSLQVKRPEAEVHQAPESSGEVKNEWRHSSTPPICKGWPARRALRAAL